MPYGVLPMIVVLLMYVLAALAFYWVIRLGVRHGTLDAYRIDRVDRRIARMTSDEAYTGSEAE